MNNRIPFPYRSLKKLQTITLFFLSSLTLLAQEGFEAPLTAQGEVLIFGGIVKDRTGTPLPGVSVEIWQTDEQGIYRHPGDRGQNRRDAGFQGFGTSISDEGGNYRFRTLLPGRYGSRPRHIHITLKQGSRTLLITQIYFTKDGETRGVGGSPRGLYMDLEEIPESSIRKTFTGSFDFVVDTGEPGTLALTGRQSEGPFYPVQDVSLYDNDLASVP
jgi:hypothetical protein